MMDSLKHNFKKSITQISRNTPKFKIALAISLILMVSLALLALLPSLCSVCLQNFAFLALRIHSMMKLIDSARLENRLSRQLQIRLKCIVQSFDDCRFP